MIAVTAITAVTVTMASHGELGVTAAMSAATVTAVTAFASVTAIVTTVAVGASLRPIERPGPSDDRARCSAVWSVSCEELVVDRMPKVRLRGDE